MACYFGTSQHDLQVLTASNRKQVCLMTVILARNEKNFFTRGQK